MTLSAEYIQTGNKDFISKKSQLFGIKNVAVKGESIIEENVMLRGDLRRFSYNFLNIHYLKIWRWKRRFYSYWNLLSDRKRCHCKAASKNI